MSASAMSLIDFAIEFERALDAEPHEWMHPTGVAEVESALVDMGAAAALQNGAEMARLAGVIRERIEQERIWRLS
jgi:hypothetical protein